MPGQVAGNGACEGRREMRQGRLMLARTPRGGRSVSPVLCCLRPENLSVQFVLSVHACPPPHYAVVRQKKGEG